MKFKSRRALYKLDVPFRLEDLVTDHTTRKLWTLSFKLLTNSHAMDDLNVLPIWPDVQLDDSATPLQRVYNWHRAAVARQLIPHKI